jgi:hypothetical protein
VLVLATQAAAAASTGPGSGKARSTVASKRAIPSAKRPVSLERRLELKLGAIKGHRSTIRFFDNHRWLLPSEKHAPIARTARARAARARAARNLARTTRNVVAIRRALQRRTARRLASASPRVAICDVFGRRYCSQALSVSWCESRHSTSAQNGQYLGLFQMGSSERRLFGHGDTAREQAAAAHRYFVVSGRDWSPWSCKPAYAS